MHCFRHCLKHAWSIAWSIPSRIRGSFRFRARSRYSCLFIGDLALGSWVRSTTSVQREELIDDRSHRPFLFWRPSTANPAQCLYGFGKRFLCCVLVIEQKGINPMLGEAQMARIASIVAGIAAIVVHGLFCASMLRTQRTSDSSLINRRSPTV